MKPIDGALHDRNPTPGTALARMLREHASGADRGAALAAAAFDAWGEGHCRVPVATVGIDPNGLGDDPLICNEADAGDPARARPVVLRIENGSAYAYLQRVWAAESRVAAAVGARARAAAAAASGEAAAHVRALETAAGVALDDDQRHAACAMAERAFALVVGGPGTGKTTTAALGVAAALRMGERAVYLAAPTGKAAARLGESLSAFADRLAAAGVEPEIQRALRAPARTLHRALGRKPLTWLDREPPVVQEGVWLIDEGSMIDIELFDRLFRQTGPAARIVVLGDPDQLAGVGVGSVLADVAAADPAGCVFRLGRAHRFEVSGLAEQARALRSGDAASLLTARTAADEPVVVPAASPAAVRAAVERVALPAYAAAAIEADAAAAAVRVDEVRVLAALREGPFGAAGLNEWIERRLNALRVPLVLGRPRHMPILVTANDPETGLSNGDVGVLTRADGREAVYFGATGRTFALARLPAWQPAWALTVHKSQGSQYDHVLLVLPPDDLPVVTRELVYTAVTRARRSARIAADADALQRAAARRVVRAGGLSARLA